MIQRKRSPALVLLVALALFVGVPLSPLALERPPDIVISQGDQPVQILPPPPPPPPPSLVASNGDPDDWASRSEEEARAGEATLTETGVSNDQWLDYLELLSELVLRIKLNLAGIL